MNTTSKELPDWVKETHFVLPVGDTILRIPKGQDIALRFFSNILETALNRAMNKEPVTLKKALMPLYDSLPNFLPTALLPLIEASANYSYFLKRPIVPQYQQNLSEKMQYGPYQTSFAKWMGEKLGLSPRKVDHIIAGYGGSLGMSPFKAYDILSGERQLDTAKEELPFLRGIFLMPYKNPKSVQEFYEKLDEQSKLAGEYKITGNKPDGFDPALFERLKAIRKQMQELNKRENDVINTPNMSADERRRRQTAIQKQRIQLVERAK